MDMSSALNVIENISRTTLLEALPTPCALFSYTGQYLFGNRAFVNEFSRFIPQQGEVSFLNHFEPVEADGHEHYLDYWIGKTLGASETNAHRESAYFHPNHKTYVLNVSALEPAAHPEIPGGIPPGLLLTTIENPAYRQETVSRKRAMHEELFMASRSMSVSEMATTLAHELNQPIGTIINCLRISRKLLSKPNLDSTKIENAHLLAIKQAEQIRSIISRIREFVSNKSPSFSICSMPEIIDECVDLMQLDAIDHRVQVSVSLSDGLPLVLVDKVMIQQVVTNLMRNAFEAMENTPPRQRKLLIRLDQDAQGRVRVEIEDRGKGISESQRNQVFNSFFTTKKGGMGAGLAICKSFIELHHGNLYFEENPDRGLTFIFTIPIYNNSDSEKRCLA